MIEELEDGVSRINDIQVINHHKRHQCVGPFCPIHNPMPGPWDSWPLYWREDRAIMERICPHGVGHPAAESFSYWLFTHQSWQIVHGCDGCCTPPEEWIGTYVKPG